MRFRPYAEYRDSGVEWLTQVPTHWEVKRFKALLSRNDGGVWGDDSAGEGMIVLRSTEQTVDGRWRIENPATRALTPREVSESRLEVDDLVVTKSSGSELHIGKTPSSTNPLQLSTALSPTSCSGCAWRSRIGPGTSGTC